MIFSLQDDCVLYHKVMLHFHDERKVQQTRKYRWCARIVSCQSVWGGISKMFGDIEAITNSNHEMIHVVCHSQQHRSRLLFFLDFAHARRRTCQQETTERGVCFYLFSVGLVALFDRIAA